MSRKPSIAVRWLALLLAALSQACAVSFKAERITLDSDSDNGPGIVYALPKTQLSITVPVTVAQSSANELAQLRLWKATCEGLSDQARQGTFFKIGTESSKAESAPARVGSSQVIDRDHVYRVQASQDNPFMTVEHAFDNSDIGIVTKAASTGQNDTGKVLFDVVKTLAVQGFSFEGLDADENATAMAAMNVDAKSSRGTTGVLAKRAGSLERRAQQVQKMAGARQETNERRTGKTAEPVDPLCRVASKPGVLAQLLDARLSGRDEPKLDALNCAQVACIAGALEVAEGAVALARLKATAHLEAMNGSQNSASYPATYAAEALREVERLESSFTRLEAALHITGKSRETTVQFGVAPFAPAEARPYPQVAEAEEGSCLIEIPAASLTQVTQFLPGSGAWCATNLSSMLPLAGEAGSPAAAAAANQLSNDAWLFRVTPLPETPDSGAPKAGRQVCGAGADCGYRYRVVAQGRVDLVRLSLDRSAFCKTEAAKDCEEVVSPGRVVTGELAKFCADTGTKSFCKPDGSLTDGGLSVFCKKGEVGSGQNRYCGKQPKRDANASCTAAKNLKYCTPRQTVREVIEIAQYGPIASLPARFTGKDAKVELAFTATGAMKSIRLGQKARDGAELTSAIKDVGEASLAVREKRLAAAQKETDAAKTAEVDAVKAANELLEAQLKNDLLKRCKQDRDNLPPGSQDVPASCKN